MRNDGGSAFPKQPMIHTPYVGDTVMEQGGMSLRDYFAAAALRGLITPNPWGAAEAGSVYWIVTAQVAYAAADAMLIERDRPKPPLEVTEEHREQGATDLERAYPERRP